MAESVFSISITLTLEEAHALREYLNKRLLAIGLGLDRVSIIDAVLERLVKSVEELGGSDE